MGFFCNTHIDYDEDEEFLIKKQKYKYQYDTSGRNAYKHRFLCPFYISQLKNDLFISKKITGHGIPQLQKRLKNIQQQIIYKNIGARNGKIALQNLMSYLSRNLNHQIDDGINRLPLYDSNHSIISDNKIDQHQNEFSDDFKGKLFRDEHSYIIGLFEKKKEKKININDLDFSIWRVGTEVKFRDNWSQTAIVDELHENHIKVSYQFKGTQLSEYRRYDEIVPTRTSENIRIFDHSKAENPEKMLIAHDDARYSIHKKAMHDFEKNIPNDFHHLMFSFGGNDYDIDIGHDAFRDFLDDSFTRRGFDFIYTFHNDTHNPHYHVICKSQSNLNKGKQFPTGKQDNFILRKELNHHLRNNGIDRSVLRNCDRAWEFEQELSLADKFKAYPEKNSFNRGDVFDYISTAIDDYYTQNPLIMDDDYPPNVFEEQLRRTMSQCKKKEIPETLTKMIEKSKDIDPFLHQAMIDNFSKKLKRQNQYEIDKKKKRLKLNLKNTHKDIEKHSYPLSSQQSKTYDKITKLLEHCTPKKEKRQAAEKDYDRGMSR